jgi:hypothetical protein
MGLRRTLLPSPSQTAVNAVVICSCAILSATHWGAEARGDPINIWSLMLTVAALYALARSYGSLRMATFTVTFGTTAAYAFTFVFDQLVASDNAARTTSSLALAAFHQAPRFCVSCQFIYGILLGMQPLAFRVSSGSLAATICLWTANLVCMHHRTADPAFLSVLLARTALPLSVGFLAAVVSAPHSGRAQLYAALGVPPPSPPNAPPGPASDDVEPGRGQRADDSEARVDAERMLISHQQAPPPTTTQTSISREEQCMISHQEASVKATRLDSGAAAAGSGSGPGLWISWLLEKWRIEDEAPMLPPQPRPQPARRHEGQEDAKANSVASTSVASSSSNTPLWPSPAAPAAPRATTPGGERSQDSC